jgi:hypothetical protein
MYSPTARTFIREIRDADDNVTQVEIVLSSDDLLIVRSLEEEASDVAAMMALAGDLIGEWTTGVEIADAKYRRWRAQQSETQAGAAEKAPAEWKVKAAIEAHPEFDQHKVGIAQLTGELEFLRAYFAGLQVKSTQIRGLMDRDGAASRQIGKHGVPSGR